MGPLPVPFGMLHNTRTNRYHPMPFRYAPPPSGDLFEGTPRAVGRFRSIGHHTEGFATLEEAVAWTSAQPNGYIVAGVWPWDGVESPAVVTWLAHAEIEPQLGG